jgi:Tol biopolymer transport system component
MFAPLVAALAISQAGAVPPTLFSYSGVTIDPAGRTIVSIDSSQAQGAAGTHGVITLRGLDGKVSGTIDPCAACRYSAPTWSPDGSKLAFLANTADGVTLYVSENGAARAVTTIKGLVSTPRWSPDGQSIAILLTLNPSKETGATQAGARQVGEIGQLSLDSQRIAVIPVAGGEPHMVSPADTFIYEYDWTPDGKGFVVTSAKGNGDNNWWIATLGHVDAASGKLRVLAAPKMQMNMPHVSPDGRTVAFIGGLMSDFGSVGGDVYTVSIDGGEPVDVTPGFAGTFNGIAWRGPRPSTVRLA